MRDKVALHVDSDVIDKGLDELSQQRDVDLCRGEGSKSVRSSMTLGLESTHNGLGLDRDSYGAFLEHVSDDHGVGESIQEAFVLATRSAGIPYGEE